ncbi:MAG: hypothetical protein AAGD28_02445 [Bacteroidota bacterium]
MDDHALKQYILIINQVFDLEKKINAQSEGPKLDRNFRRIRAAWESLGLSYYDPTGEAYDETRTDCEASISGDSEENLFIQETLKPIIRQEEDGFIKIIQRAIVIVAQKDAQK